MSKDSIDKASTKTVDSSDKAPLDSRDDPVALILTDGEVEMLMRFIHEFRLGPKAPSDEEWKWLESVQGLPSADYYGELLEKLNKFRVAAITYNGR